MRITWAQALSWRLRRQFLASDGGSTGSPVTVGEVVGRLGALPAWSGDPEYAVRIRHGDGAAGTVDRSLRDGTLVRVFAFRGATHLMTPDSAAVHLPLRAAGRMWERQSWQDFYRLAPADWPELRSAVREAVADGPLTLPGLADTVTADRRYAHLREHLSEAGTFLKPFFWQGDLCFGPSQDGQPTVQALADNPRWPGLPDLDAAGREAVTGYLSAYGPATPDRVHYWLGEGLGAGRKRIRGWLADLADRLTEVEVDGEPALVPTHLAEDLAAAEPTDEVRLLTGHDQWVLGPGTADTAVVPPTIRAAVTRGANLVTVGGVVSGTWKVTGSHLTVTWADGAGASPSRVEEEVARVGRLLGKELEPRQADG